MAQLSSSSSSSGGSSSSTTKSIDVGGVFLMDLAVADSELTLELSEQQQQQQRAELTHHRQSRSGHLQPQIYDTTKRHSQLAGACRPLDYQHNNLYHHHHHQQPHQHLHHHHHHHHHHQDKSIRLSPTYQQFNENASNNGRTLATSTAPQQQQQQPPTTTSVNHSLGRSTTDNGLAGVINCDGRTLRATTGGHCQGPYADELEGPLSSLSDESYVASSGTSLSASSLTGSSAASGCHEGAGAEFCSELDDGASTTTREDSGVLDMKDLEGVDGRPAAGAVAAAAASRRGNKQPVVPQSFERETDDDDDHNSDRDNGKPAQEKSISANIMATNLINKTANGNANFHNHQQQATTATSTKINYGKQPRAGGKLNDAGQQHRNTHNCLEPQGQQATATVAASRGNQNQRAVSASLPIQVPARQMKKNLNRMKLKLNLMKEEEQQELQAQLAPPPPSSPLDQQQQQQQHEPITPEQPLVRRGDRNRPALENIAAFGANNITNNNNSNNNNNNNNNHDDDAFLDQEFNANHQNHYPIDELDREHLTAGEDPMRLFASIQALAKSLHEDAELFGSLPPKRMLESPIRSLALV